MSIVEIPPEPQPPERRRTLYERLRWLIFGEPIASQRLEETLVAKIFALPVFCSDAISSVAYGGQQILLALCAAGLWLPEHRALYGSYTLSISLVIATLLGIVVLSYRQTIFAYPNGGGSYAVSRANLGTTPGLIAGSALLIDYVLTVAVSVAAGMQNIKDVPLFAPLNIGQHLVPYCLGAVVLITLANLRGLRESGGLFALPHYGFVLMCYLMIIIGLAGPSLGWHFHPEFVNQVVPPSGGGGGAFKAFGMAVVLRAFANGCSAMTGVEAVSNGVPAFREPKARNAAITLTCMALILASIFIGISWLSVKFHVVYWEHAGFSSPAMIDQISGMIFGKHGAGGWAYLITQVSAALILIVAAETSFAGFPLLASIMARDGFLPRQLMHLGDKLGFNNGIILLSTFASFFIILEQGSVDRLIPYFAIGVFLAFTLSQTGMVRHWFSDRGPGWRQKAAINGLGALACFVVVIDIVLEKFFDGAWLILLVIVALLAFFKKVHWHYAKIAEQLSPSNYTAPSHPMKSTVLILVQGVNAGILNALDYARSLSSECQAVYVEMDPQRTSMMKANWAKFVPDMPLVVLESPYRSLLRPIMHYLDTVHKVRPNHRITVIIAEFVPTSWWETTLHGNTGLLLKLALLGRRDIVVTNVRYWLDEHELCPVKSTEDSSVPPAVSG